MISFGYVVVIKKEDGLWPMTGTFGRTLKDVEAIVLLTFGKETPFSDWLTKNNAVVAKAYVRDADILPQQPLTPVSDYDTLRRAINMAASCGPMVEEERAEAVKILDDLVRKVADDNSQRMWEKDWLAVAFLEENGYTYSEQFVKWFAPPNAEKFLPGRFVVEPPAPPREHRVTTNTVNAYRSGWSDALCYIRTGELKPADKALPQKGEKIPTQGTFVQPPPEELIRFCPECGSIGEIDKKYHKCCPDGNSARMVPKKFAEKMKSVWDYHMDALKKEQDAHHLPNPVRSETHESDIKEFSELQGYLREHYGNVRPAYPCGLAAWALHALKKDARILTALREITTALAEH